VPHATVGLDRRPGPAPATSEAVGQHLPVVGCEIGKQRSDVALEFLGRMAEDRELLIDPADTVA
jgi:hypothetical protein